MKKTVGQLAMERNPRFIWWGICATWYGLIGKIYFKLHHSLKYLDKSVDYLNKRFDLMMEVYKDYHIT